MILLEYNPLCYGIIILYISVSGFLWVTTRQLGDSLRDGHHSGFPSKWRGVASVSKSEISFYLNSRKTVNVFTWMKNCDNWWRVVRSRRQTQKHDQYEGVHFYWFPVPYRSIREVKYNFMQRCIAKIKLHVFRMLSLRLGHHFLISEGPVVKCIDHQSADIIDDVSFKVLRWKRVKWGHLFSCQEIGQFGPQNVRCMWFSSQFK